MIRRRHVIYVEGYDPQGAEGYYNIFQRSWKRFLKNWPLAQKVGDLQIDSEDFAHWDIELAAPNWQVYTRYEFLRQEQFIRANMAEPIWRIIWRSLCWTADYLFSGTIFRVFRASWQYGLVLMYFQWAILSWLLVSGAGGAAVAYGVAHFFDMHAILSAVTGAAAAIGIFHLIRLLANNWYIVQINSHWPYLCEFARGEPTCFDHAINVGAERLIAVARANDVDEILVIGHSGGGVMAPAVVARALELDPDVGQRGPRVVLMTLGSLMPGIGLSRNAKHLHAIIERIAVEPSVRWIDAQSNKDILNFERFDPVAGIDIDAGPRRCNPFVWQVRFRDMLSEKFYDTLRWSFFRLHYQFIMANDMRAPYDYFMLIGGPLTPEEWAKDGRGALARFEADGSYKGA